MARAGGSNYELSWYDDDGREKINTGDTFREAIDAAMATDLTTDEGA
jgi:hypothetical protein